MQAEVIDPVRGDHRRAPDEFTLEGIPRTGRSDPVRGSIYALIISTFNGMRVGIAIYHRTKGARSVISHADIELLTGFEPIDSQSYKY